MNTPSTTEAALDGVEPGPQPLPARSTPKLPDVVIELVPEGRTLVDAMEPAEMAAKQAAVNAVRINLLMSSPLDA
jgi:hypothetical protein